MVDAFSVGCGWRTADGEVPFEKVGVKGSGVKRRCRVCGKVAGFGEDAFYGWGFGVEGGHFKEFGR